MAKHQTQPATEVVTSDSMRRLQLALEAQIVAAGASGVTTFNSRGGAVNLTTGDVTLALGFAPASSVTNTGDETKATIDAKLGLPSDVTKFYRGDGTWAVPAGGGGGSGTVTSVSVVTANGVSGSVATSTVTPAITLTLGAITPTSVAASGTVTGSNLSGTNTGDQTSVTGNAGTATALQTARTINGVAFDGTGNITINAVDSTARIASSAAGAFGLTLLGSANLAAAKASLAYTKGDVGLGSVDNTADAAKVVASAATLTTPRTINGVSFNGSANITINAVDSTARVPDTRTVSTTAPLAGGGALSGNLTLSITAASGAAAGSMSSADFTKLAGVATGATANSSDATLLARANHTGTQAPATILFSTTARFLGRITASGGAGEEMTGAQATTLLDLVVAAGTKGLMSGSDKTKLDGIATGATANATDAALIARGNHTGTQSIATILAAATSRIFGRITAAGGVGEELTGTQATTLLDVFTSALKGLAPASGGGTANFLRADGTWAVPPGSGGGITDSDKGDVVVSGGGTVWTLDTVTVAKGGTGLITLTADKLYKGNGTGALVDSGLEVNAGGELIAPSGIWVADDPAAVGWDGQTKVPTKNAVYDAIKASIAPYRTILDCSGSHTAARVAGLYGFTHGQPLAISGTGTLYPLDVIYIDSADYAGVMGLAAKLRIRCSLAVNDVAPTGNFTISLHPVTRPATSGGVGLAIYTIGAAVAGSGVTSTAPAADSLNNLVGADFALPANGHYIVAMTSTATVAASSHLHFSAALQLHYA